MSSQKILILGATGYTGQALLRVSPNIEGEIIAHLRPESAAGLHLKTLARDVCAEVYECPWEKSEIETLIRVTRPSVIVSLLGTTKKRQRSDQRASYKNIDFGLNLLAIQSAVTYAPSARFVLLSSLGSDAHSFNSYLRWKGKIEEALIESGLSYLILRPSFISGSDRPESRPSERLGASLTQATLSTIKRLGHKRLKSLYHRYRPLTAQILARQLLMLIKTKATGIIESEALSRGQSPS